MTNTKRSTTKPRKTKPAARSVPLTKLTANQRGLLNLLALSPGGLDYERIRHYGMMVISSVKSAYKPYVTKDATGRYTLTEAGKARQQDKPYSAPRVQLETVAEIETTLYLETARLLSGVFDPKAPTIHAQVCKDSAQWALERIIYKTVAPRFASTPTKQTITRLIAAVAAL